MPWLDPIFPGPILDLAVLALCAIPVLLLLLWYQGRRMERALWAICTQLDQIERKILTSRAP